jgi:hypothetical protein
MIPEINILSDIVYNNYAVLICHLDDEYLLRTGYKSEGRLLPSEEINRAFVETCVKYHVGIDQNRENYNKKNKINSLPLDGFLYNPACFTAFGATDGLCIVATDDFDIIDPLTTDLNVPLRQICVAFCPKLLSENEFHFCEPEKIFDGKLPSKENIYQPSEHPFMEDKPLITITYYKLNGMAILGPGLLMQQALFKAIRTRIKRVLEELTLQVQQHTENSFNKIISLENIKSYRCVILDPQGWADVATIMFCNNYSVMASVIAGLRTLIFENLFEEERCCPEEKRLEEIIKLFNIHKMVANIDNHLCASEKQTTRNYGDPSLRYNHIFYSTFTTLGISQNALKSVDELEVNNKIGGILASEIKISTLPGHWKRISNKHKDKAIKQSPKNLLDPKNFRWFEVGRYDSSFNVDFAEISTSFNQITPCELVKQTKFWIEHLSGSGRETDRIGSDIIDFSTNIQIPIPLDKESTENSRWTKLLFPDVKSEHVSLFRVLYKTCENLFKSPSSPLFHIEKIKECIRKIRIPSPLSTSIVYLFSDFATCLSDPFLFDNVLDLYDSFATLYRILTEYPPENDAIGYNDYQWLSFLSEKEVEELAIVVDVLENALMHRVQMAFRDVERWDIAIDFRGGLNRLLNAADAPLKCGLGILKEVMRGHTLVYPNRSDTKLNLDNEKEEIGRSNVGGISRICFSPRSHVYNINIGQNENLFLGFVDINISNIASPSEYCIHFHEMAHLILDFLRTDECIKAKQINNCGMQKNCFRIKKHKPLDKCQFAEFERLEEVFSEMLVHYLIFEDDTITFLKNYLGKYSLDPISTCKNDRHTVLRMIEVFIRGFLVTDPFRKPCKTVKYNIEEHSQDCSTGQMLYDIVKNYELTDSDVDDAKNRFLMMVESVGPFFIEFNRLWAIKEVKDYTIRQFEMIFKKSYLPLCCIWDDIKKIYEGVCLGAVDKKFSTNPDEKDKANLLGQIAKGLEEGRPIIRTFYRDPRDHRPEGLRTLDTFFLIRSLLRFHIQKIYNEMDTNKAIFLIRDLTTGKPNLSKLPEDLMGWNKQILDRNFNGFFSVDSLTRRKHLLNRITVIKTLWDVSTTHRARRMKEILKIAWPQQFEIKNNSTNI